MQFRLKRPFPHLPEALAGPGGNVPAIMPARLAAESPFKPVAEVVGRDPYRFLKDEHISGARAVFERFAEYQPRVDGLHEPRIAGHIGREDRRKPDRPGPWAC